MLLQPVVAGEPVAAGQFAAAAVPVAVVVAVPADAAGFAVVAGALPLGGGGGGGGGGRGEGRGERSLTNYYEHYAVLSTLRSLLAYTHMENLKRNMYVNNGA